MAAIRLREIRQQQHLTLKQLAGLTGLSVATLSQVERAVTDPSLDALRRLAAALGVTLSEIFHAEERVDIAVVRRDERVVIQTAHSGIPYTRVSPGFGTIELLEGELLPNTTSSTEKFSHVSDEAVVVLSGQLIVEVSDGAYVLEAGDSCSYDSRLPHRYVNNSSAPARFLLAVVPLRR